MLEVFRKLGSLLNPREKRRALVVFALMLCVAFLETFGVGSIMPFVTVLMNPDVVEKNAYLNWVFNWFGFSSIDSFLFVFGIVLLVVFVSSLAFKALTAYAILRFSTMRLHTLACRLFASYLRQPYEFFLGRNTSVLAKSILAEVSQVTNGVLVPVMNLIAATIMAIALIALLVVVEPVLSITVAACLGLAYGCLYLLTRGLVSRIGAGRLEANRRRFVLTNEVLGGVKELRLLGRENDYLDRFRQPSLRFAQYQAASRVVSDLPRYGIEAVAFGGMLVALLYLVQHYEGLQDALPLIALYGFAVYRLLPAFQQIFASVSQIRFNMPAVNVLYDDLIHKEQDALPDSDFSAPPLRLQRELRLEDVKYYYPGAEQYSLKGINLDIAAGSSVAFVGRTGAGKSTIADIILGLLSPTEGQVLIDGQRLEGANARAWQCSLGYVPQSIFLADDTVAANIAFGLPPEHIDLARVEEAAKVAQIHGFIVNELPKGYQTAVGERGVRISGGQRQRLAIARALYHDPDVIVFDEATSALDNATETAVMEAIEQLRGRKTIILIAHRLTTVRECNRIFMLDGGRLIDQGSYKSLMAGSNDFRSLAKTE